MSKELRFFQNVKFHCQTLDKCECLRVDLKNGGQVSHLIGVVRKSNFTAELNAEHKPIDSQPFIDHDERTRDDKPQTSKINKLI